MSYFYYLYGFRIASELKLPELIPAHALTEPDIRIAIASLSDFRESTCPNGDWVQLAPEVYQIRMQHSCYRVEEGRRILVDPSPRATPGDVRLWLLVIALVALIHQRGLLPLHASAVVVDGEVHAFCGESGAGKSTLAFALGQRGFEVLTDDAGMAIPNRVGQWLFHPGVPRIKLWRESLEHFGLYHRSMIRAHAGEDKYHLSLDDLSEKPPRRLRRLYMLEKSDNGLTRIAALRGFEAIEAVRRQVYRQKTAKSLGRSASLLSKCGEIVRDVPVYRFTRPWSLESLEHALNKLENHLRNSF
jgi:hypothetical protein